MGTADPGANTRIIMSGTGDEDDRGREFESNRLRYDDGASACGGWWLRNYS